MSCTSSLIINPGRTLQYAFRWAESARTYKTVTAVSLTAPVVLTVPSHGLPDGWQFRLESLRGPEALNNDLDDPTSFYLAKVLTPDSLQLELNGLGLKALVGQGALSYYSPADLAGLSGRFTLKASQHSQVALLDSTAAVTVDNVTKSIDLQVSALDTARLTPGQAWYALDLVDSSNPALVYAIAAGPVQIL